MLTREKCPGPLYLLDGYIVEARFRKKIYSFLPISSIFDKLKKKSWFECLNWKKMSLIL